MFVLRPCYEEELDEVLFTLNNYYYPYEPLAKINKMTGDFLELPQSLLPQGHSIVAVPSEQETDAIVGVALNDKPPQEFPNIYTNSQEDVKFQEMFNYIERESNVLKEAPDAMEVRMLAVHPLWRNRGIAASLLTASKAVAREAGYKHIKMYCTSAYSSRLLKKLDWKLQYSLEYKEYARTHGGIVAPGAPHNFCDLFVNSTEVAQSSNEDAPSEHLSEFFCGYRKKKRGM